MNQVKSLKQLSYGGLAAAVLLIIVPQEAFAMHIMEGFLPPMWALAWWLLFLPCLWYGLVRLRHIVQEESNQKVLLALCGAFIFVLSALKIPSVTGSCSHPTGVGLAVILFRAGRGGGAGGDRSAVPGAAAGAWRPDHPWRQRDVDGGNRPDGRLSGVEAGLSGGDPSRCRGLSLRHAGGSDDLLCHLRPARGGLSRSGNRGRRIDRQVYGHLLPDADPDRHRGRLAHRDDLRSANQTATDRRGGTLI